MHSQNVVVVPVLTDVSDAAGAVSHSTDGVTQPVPRDDEVAGRGASTQHGALQKSRETGTDPLSPLQDSPLSSPQPASASCSLRVVMSGGAEVETDSADAKASAGTGDGRVPNADTPSSQYEAEIVSQLRTLLTQCQESWRTSLSVGGIVKRSFLLGQNAGVFLTCVMLLISCMLYPMRQTVLCTCLFLLVYAFCTALQAYLFWARVTETKYRTAAVMNDALVRWSARIEEMPNRPSQTPKERRALFVESFAQLPATAFRMVAVVDDRTFRLKHIPKCVMVRRSKRLDEATLKVRRYMEPKAICKLVDAMRITLESDAIVLKPLTDRAKPPRLPNLLMSQKKFIEEDATTDESDHERDSRTALGGGNSFSVSQHMEYFTQRVFLLLWIVGMVLTIGTGVLYYYMAGAPLGEGVFLDPAVALLGLLPVNAIVLNRLLVLYANVYLDKLFHYIVSKRSHSFEDRLPRFSMWSTAMTMVRIILRLQPTNGSRNPQVFSSSLVDGFGMASVIAMLDQTGIVTDMVPLPIQVLLMRAGAHPESSSSDEEGSIVGCLTEKNKRDARERQREMKKQVKRKKFHEQRFLELRLTPSGREDLAVTFSDRKELHRHQAHINPVCLCILLHALAREPMNLETWTEPFRFCDRSLLWCRALHWIPRACSFNDSVVKTFTIIARVFQYDTRMQSGYHNSFPEQACSLLVESSDGLLHVFTIGTPFMVTSYCTTLWAGTSVEELDTEAKKELVFMGKHQWEEGMCQETIALAHRVLPERYRRFVKTLPHSRTSYSEFFFANGVEVKSTSRAVLGARGGTRGAGKARRPSPGGTSPTTRAHHGTEVPQKHPYDDEEEEEEEEEETTSDERQWSAAGYVGHHYRQRSRRGGRGRRSASAPCVPSLTSAFDDRLGAQRRNASFGDLPSQHRGELEEDDFLTAQTFVQLMVTTGHTFLGLTGVRDSVRPNVQAAMAMLDDAGVRCMYFCSENERQTRSFGSRVGLETDWNCCISLKEDAVALDKHSIRAQLPFGIKSIRKHILHVDPIPLQVHLFSHALGVSKRAMLSILQDNHEIVVAVGSVFNHSNVRCFVQADFSIGVLPTRKGPNAEKEHALRHGRIVEPSDFSAQNPRNRDLPLYRNVAELIGCSCTLRSPPTTSILPILATMVKQARLRISGIGNGVEFVLHANVLVVMINTISLIVGAPLLMSPTITVFELNCIIPILALSCTYAAYSGMDPMRTMTSRHNYFVRLAIFRHSVIVWTLRYLPSVIALVVLGITASTRLCNCGVLGLLDKTADDCMSSAQGYVALTLNYWLMIHCWTHISRHHPISLNFSLRLGHGKRSTYLFQSFRWVCTSLVVQTVSIVLVMLDTPVHSLRYAFFPSTAHFLVSLFFPVLLLALDWPIKRWRERRFNNMQKFRRLSFGTRLGMHSPRGDYEPEGITYSSGNVGPVSPDGGDGADSTTSVPAKVSWGKQFSEAFYRFASLREGKLELNCVCCDHIGGNYASYHVTANV